LRHGTYPIRGRQVVRDCRDNSVRRLKRELKRLKKELDLSLKREQQWTDLESRIRSASARWQAQPYGDLTRLNHSRLILGSVGPSLLREIAQSYMSLLETSTALYEKNGAYAMGLFSSGWCRLLDGASRRRCGTEDNREALASGKWHCHESCWNEASRKSIETKRVVDVGCRGGIRIYAIPIRADSEVIGSINFGYGDPPDSADSLRAIARRFDVRLADLRAAAGAYIPRPPRIVDAARKQLKVAARLIGEVVSRRRAEEALTCAHSELQARLNEKIASLKAANRRMKAEVEQRVQVEAKLKANEEDLQHNEEQLRSLAARLITVAEDERQRIARELHDDLGQRIAALIVETETGARQLPLRCREEIRSIKHQLEELSEKVRETARQLHNSILDVLGLPSALNSLCLDYSRRGEASIRFRRRNVPSALPREVALSLFRIAQECLRNIWRHAGAKRIKVSLVGTGRDIRLSVSDDGIGFDPEAVKGKTTLGFVIMQERVRMIRGTLTVKSQPAGGTQVRVRIPLPLG
jgi:signal transduction histidine kinase